MVWYGQAGEAWCVQVRHGPERLGGVWQAR
jgi:hypothetical protein